MSRHTHFLRVMTPVVLVALTLGFQASAAGASVDETIVSTESPNSVEVRAAESRATKQEKLVQRALAQRAKDKDQDENVVTNELAARSGETKDLDATTHSETDERKSVAAECPADRADRITPTDVFIDGVRVKGTQTLQGNVDSASAVKITFTIAKGCEDIRVSLAGYDAKSGVWNEDEVDEQELVDSATGVFDEGTYTLAITAPECFFQIDFVEGKVLTQLGDGPGGQGLYGDRKIDWANGGKACVEDPPADVDEEVKPNPIVEVPTAIVADPPMATEVLPVVLTQPEVAPAELARTGVSVVHNAYIGVVLLSVGVGLVLSGRRLRRAVA